MVWVIGSEAWIPLEIGAAIFSGGCKEIGSRAVAKPPADAGNAGAR